MSSFVTVWLYVCVIFADRVYGITTKTIPLILSNTPDSSQYVQIRSNISQPTRNFLLQHKSSLSPVQQTHILDDVQKNQRIHYHSGGPANLDDRQKSLFGSSAQTSPQSLFDQSHLKYANLLNINSLSPPPVQTVVLSPQQTLPTSPPHDEQLSFFRPSTRTDIKSTYPELQSINPVSQIEPLKVQQENPFIHDLNRNQKSHYYQLPSSTLSSPAKAYSDINKFTSAGSQYPYFSKTDTISPYSFKNFNEKLLQVSTSSTKPYLTKNSSSIFTPLLEKPRTINSDKVIKEIIIKTNPEELIAKDRQKFFQQLLEDKNSEDTYQNSDDQTVAQNDLSNIRNQFEKEFLRQLNNDDITDSMADLAELINSSKAISEFSLPNGQRIQISKDYNRLIENDDGSNKIKAIVVKQPTTTVSPANLLEELTKGVVPPGAEFEVIKRNKDGGLEEINKLPPNLPQKKVTFVILEEQSDGTVKVQGVRGSEKESLQESGEEVDTIIRKIKEGELKLPPSTRLSSKQSQKSTDKTKNNLSSLDEDVKSKRKTSSSDSASRSVKQTNQESKYFVPTPAVLPVTSTPVPTITTPTLPNMYFTSSSVGSSPYQYFSSPSSYYFDKFTRNNLLSSTLSPAYASTGFESQNILDTDPWNLMHQITAASSLYASSTQNPIIDNNLGLFHLNNSGYIANLFSALKNPSSNLLYNPPVSSNIVQFPLLPTTSGSTVVQKNNGTNTFQLPYIEPTIVTNAITVPTVSTTIVTEKPKEEISSNAFKLKRDRPVIRKTNKKPSKEIRKDNDEEESNILETKSEESASSVFLRNITLSDILKNEGFFAMARFLRQSGLDNILNDTGPFTLFIPTDKAFRTLLIQLGGPDKAEEKFKENPRLLSGLLLHHVIPGAFRVSTLQDEMTGVSLAGTQLRVNTYTTHDIEWNDITVVTVNGAKILDEKDIVIPQGIAHAIDRVMFPLPVGNLLQSLQADRENRYSNFLKILEESDLSFLLTGSKTFTLFAPLNRAFTHAEFTKIVSDPNESKSFVLRHLVPGALYSAGMKYYQVRDSMEDGQQVTLYKEAGKIKVNTAHVITRNIPATNGVIHAIDSFL